MSKIPLAAGENLYTRFDVAQSLRAGALGELQPDVAKVGGITEFMRVAALASASGLRVSPHSSVTGLSQAATVHVLSAIDNAGYFEADVTPEPEFREQLTSRPYEVSAQGTVTATNTPGIGVHVDEDFIIEHPYIPGPNFLTQA
jgi:L-alanine-DL-glutamate epimerase-like enolase superfamily enzyme